MKVPVGSWFNRLPDLLAIAAIIMAVLFGLYARFRGVGVWPLADDEYHTVESVGNILEQGIPAFECGGYYARAILYQYFLAFLALITGIEQISLFRGITALSNLLCLPPLYLMARKLGGRYVAMGAVVLLLLSVWEVEYARYIRMYAPFQALFVWYLYFLFRVLVDQDKASFKWIYILSLVSVFIYEAGIFLALLNFFPVLSGRSRITTPRVLLPAVILAFVYYFLTSDIMFTGDNSLPEGLILEWASDVITLGHLVIPNTFLYAMTGTPEWRLPFILLLVSLAGILYPVIRNRVISNSNKLIFLFWVLLAVLNQYSLIVYSAAVFWLVGWLEHAEMRGRDVMFMFIALLATAVFWAIYALNTSAWHAFYPAGVESPVWKMLVMFLKYPNIMDKIYRPWMAGIPFTMYLSAAIIAAGVVVSGKDGDPAARQYFRLLAALTIILCLLVGITMQPYNNSRYTFFLYPVVILLVVYSIQQVASFLSKRKTVQAYIFLFITGSYVLVADDFDAKHLAKIDHPEINFRTEYDIPKRFHLFNRMDFRTPAEYVNENMGQSDIVIASVRPAHHYLDRLDYFYVDSRNRELPGISACGGKKEIWTNAGLLYSEQMLHELIADSGTPVWLILRSDEYRYAWRTERSIAETYSDRLVYKSIDRTVAVYRFGD